MYRPFFCQLKCCSIRTRHAALILVRRVAFVASCSIAVVKSAITCSGVTATILIPIAGVTCRPGPPRSRQMTGSPAAIASTVARGPES